MFTIEHEFDHSVIVVMDNDGSHDDVELILDEDNVYIRQYDEDESFNIVVIYTLYAQRNLECIR